MGTSTTSPIKLKLVIDPLRERFLFAEVGKDFVPLPISTITGLLKEDQGMVGCMDKLYNSVQSLSGTYLLNPNLNRDILLNPISPMPTATQDESLDDSSFDSSSDDDDNEMDAASDDDNESEADETHEFYTCVTCLSKRSSSSSSSSSSSKTAACYVTENSTSICPGCDNRMLTPATYVAPLLTKDQVCNREGSYVKDVVSYIVMDDLEVKPMSGTLIMASLNKSNIKDVCCLEEKVVHPGNQEALNLLKAALQSQSALTAAFLA